MSDHDLKKLFRQFAGQRKLSIPDVDDVVELSRLPHADEAASPLHADLLRFSRDLEPVSAALSADLAATFGATGAVVTHRRASPLRVASTPRRWRAAVASALAASLVAAVVVFATHRNDAPVSASAAHAVPDRIFAGFEERNVAASKSAHGDQIFRGNFLPDEIFSSSKSNDG